MTRDLVVLSLMFLAWATSERRNRRGLSAPLGSHRLTFISAMLPP